MNTRDLLEDVIHDILSYPMRLEKIIERCLEIAREGSAQRCTIHSFDSSLTANSLVAQVRKRVDAEIVICQPSARSSGAEMRPNTSSKTKIAIVGMAGRFLSAADLESFWHLLEAGSDVHKKIPPDRFDVEKHYDSTGKCRNTSHTPYGCFIDEPGLFDPRFFNMSPREATQTDPMHRLALICAYEALEVAGYVPNRTPSTRLDRIGTFYAQTSDDWREINAAQDIDTYFISAGVRAFAPVDSHQRINYFAADKTGRAVSTTTSSSVGQATA
ncbi:MAG: hypothetical protein Q9223_003773 [Gallowayella weberi]